VVVGAVVLWDWTSACVGVGVPEVDWSMPHAPSAAASTSASKMAMER
jgi:hypothetical protein